jgi:hypothetical protein
MKKIYLSIIFVCTFVLSINAQNTTDKVLSDDELGRLHLQPAPAYLSQVVQQQRKQAPVSIAGCDSLNTVFTGTNNQDGNMFDLTNSGSAAIQITSFDQCFFNMLTDTFEIYYRPGSHAGFENSSAGWILAGKTLISPPATGTPIPIPITITVSIGAGQTYAFYLTNNATGSNNAYDNGLASGSVYKSKGGLDFKEGKGKAWPFSTTYPAMGSGSRIWNGRINFCTPTGVQSLSVGNASSVFPNPMSERATVNIDNSIPLHNALLNVYDMTGRIVYTNNNINDHTFELRHNLKNGLYIVQVENNNTIVLNQKVSVQ